MPPVLNFSKLKLGNEDVIDYYCGTNTLLREDERNPEVPIANDSTKIAGYDMTVRGTYEPFPIFVDEHHVTIPYVSSLPVKDTRTSLQLSDFESTTWKQILHSRLDTRQTGINLPCVSSGPVEERDVPVAGTMACTTVWRKENSYNDQDRIAWSKPFYILGIDRSDDENMVAFTARVGIVHEAICTARVPVDGGKSHGGPHSTPDWTQSGPLMSKDAELSLGFQNPLGPWIDSQSEIRLFEDTKCGYRYFCDESQGDSNALSVAILKDHTHGGEPDTSLPQTSALRAGVKRAMRLEVGGRVMGRTRQ